jgi:hypothetical protein
MRKMLIDDFFLYQTAPGCINAHTLLFAPFRAGLLCFHFLPPVAPVVIFVRPLRGQDCLTGMTDKQ